MRALLVAALLAGPALAQTGDPVERLADALALSADQADLVAEIFSPDDPASTWTLAAELVPTLDAGQREALFARPQRPDGARGQRAGRRGGARGAGRGDRQRDPARVAVMRAARDAALGLTEDESARLDAIVEGLDRRAAMRALMQGEVPAEIAAVLSDDQVETYRAQVALQRHLRRGRR